MERFEVPHEKLVSICIDGAQTMTGFKSGLYGLIKKDSSYPDFMHLHCVFYRENLVAQSVTFKHVIIQTLEIIKFIN